MAPATGSKGRKAKTKSEAEKAKQKRLALLAAKRAEKLLRLFEKERPKDKRPRDAIRAARAWARGEIKCGEARKAALAAHAAARKAKLPEAVAAARAAGHAAATAHVATHAKGVTFYAKKAKEAAKRKELIM